jgi:hypothetical protein
MKLGNQFKTYTKVTNMEEKFIKEMEVMKNNQVEMLETKTSIN